MPRISRSRLTPKQLQGISENFFYLLSSLRSNQSMEIFLNDFLTKEEKVMLMKRLVLFMMLKSGYSTSTIKDALHVSQETIRSYKNQLDYKDISFHKTIDILLKKKNIEAFFTNLENIAKPIENILKAKTNMKARSKLFS